MLNDAFGSVGILPNVFSYVSILAFSASAKATTTFGGSEIAALNSEITAKFSIPEAPSANAVRDCDSKITNSLAVVATPNPV